MKKIMFGLAAAIAMVAAADIESSNIVGYTTKKSAQGLTFIAPSFVEIGKNTVRLGDITLGGGNETSFGDVAQILDADGNAVTTYFWTTAGDVMDYACWTDEGMADASDVVIDRGLALLMSNENADVDILDAGEVSEETFTVKSAAGLTSIGNLFAHSIKLSNIVLSGGNETSFGDVAQLLDADGNAETTYFWTTAGDVMEYACWTDEGMADASDVEIPAGMGILLSNENAGVDITVSSK